MTTLYAWVVPGLVALLGSLFVVPLAALLGPRLGAMDTPKPLSIHTTPTPRTGGLAVLAGFLPAVGSGLLFAPGTSAGDKTTLLGLVIAGVLVAFIGLLDDVGRIPTRVEVSSLLFPALLAVLLGLRVGFGPVPYVGIPLTLFYLVGGASALNLVDGMNGLAGGVAAMDRPKPLSIHSTPTPRTGGLAVLVGFLLAVGCGPPSRPCLGSATRLTRPKIPAWLI